MNIGIIGGGSLGLLYGFYLSKQHSVTLYTNRLEQAETINANGITLLREGKSFQSAIHAEFSSNYKERFLIVTVKQYNIKVIVESLKQKEPCTILFLQNGMGHLPYLTELAHHQILLGIVEHGALRQSDSVVNHTGVGTTKIAYYQGELENEHILHDFLGKQDPSFTVQLKDHWKVMVEEKLVVNATINPLTALFRVKNGTLIENPHYFKLFRALFHEVIAVLERNDEENLWKYVQSVCKNTAPNKSSMYKDIENDKQTEIDSILGYLIKEANRKSVSIPHISFLYHAIKGIEFR